MRATGSLAMMETLKAHGMNKTRVAPDWPPLQLDEVRSLLGQYPGCEEPVEILSVSPRPFSAASVVNTKSGRVFVKRHHRSVRDRAGLLEEHAFLTHLYARGGPVPRVLSTTKVETAVAMGEWTFEVHEASEGVDIYQDALSWTPFLSRYHAYSAGKSLAQMHLAAEGFAAPARKVQPLVASFSIFADASPAAAMDRYLAARPALAVDADTRKDCAMALELLEPFHTRLQPLLPELKPLWTHNDLHASNLLWSSKNHSARAVQVIDFGLTDRTNVVHDLAHLIERNIVEWLEIDARSAEVDNVPLHIDALQAMLDGYHSVRPLTAEEAAALAPMTALCHAEFALTEADYFQSVLHSDANTRICTNGYLVGHARWYRGPGGQRLLGAMDRWVEALEK